MKKRIILFVVLAAMLVVLCSCDNQKGNRIVGGKDVQTFTYAYVYLGGQKIVEGPITQWRDYDNSDTIQLMIGGKYYLTHYSCVVMVADPAQGTLEYSGLATQDYGGTRP